MLGKKRSRILVLILAFACAVIVVMASIVITNTNQEVQESFPDIGYKLSSTILSDTFTSPSSEVGITVNNESRTEYAYSDEGLKITFNLTSAALYIGKSSTSAANSIRCVVNTSSLDDYHVLDLNANFKVKSKPSWYYGVTIRMMQNTIYIIPRVWLGTGTPVFQWKCYQYDVKAIGTMDIVAEIVNGNITVGVNGFETNLQTNLTGKVFTDLLFDKITLGSNSDNWSSPADVVLNRFEIGNNAQIDYNDHLHVTTTLGDYDFTLALQIHADYINPAQLVLMNYLADEYGVRGVMTIWMDTPDPNEYSVDTSANYTNELLALQSSGWEIGVHGVNENNTTRPNLIVDIAQFEKIFGPLQSLGGPWSNRSGHRPCR